MKYLIPLGVSIALVLGVTAVDSAFEHTISDIDLPLNFTSFDGLRDSQGHEHYFTSGIALAHFYRLQGGWAFETIDPVASAVSITQLNDELCVAYVSGSELRIAWGIESNWQIETVSMGLGQPRNPSIAISDDGTVWVCASDSVDGRLWAWDITSASAIGEPLLIDEDGDCGTYTDSIGLSGNGFQVVYQVGIPYFDMRQAVFNGTTLEVETIRTTGNQGEYCSIARGMDGSLHLAAWDGYDNNLLYGRLNEFGEWDWETPDPRWGCGRATTLALDALDRPVIAHVSSDYERLKITKYDGQGWTSEEVMLRVDVSTPRPIRIIDPNDFIFATMRKGAFSDGSKFELLQTAVQALTIQPDVVCFSPALIQSTRISPDSMGAFYVFIGRKDGYAVWNRIGSIWTHRTVLFEMQMLEDLILRLGHGDPNRIVVAVGLTLPNLYQIWVDTVDGFEVNRHLIESVPDRKLMALDLCLAQDQRDQIQIAQRNEQSQVVTVRNLSRQDDSWEPQIVDSFIQPNFHQKIALSADMRHAPNPVIASFDEELRVCSRGESGWVVTVLQPDSSYAYEGNFEVVLTGDGSPRIRMRMEVFTYTGESWNSEIVVMDSYSDFDIDPQDRLLIASSAYSTSCRIIRQDGIGWVEESLGEGMKKYEAHDCRFNGNQFFSLWRHIDAYSLKFLLLVTSTPLPPTLELTMNDRTFSSGEPFDLGYRIANGPDPLHAQLAVLLDIPVGETHLYYTWPGWQDLSHGIPTTAIDLQADQSWEETILSFTWPSGAGQMSGLSFWGFLVNGDGSGFAADTAHLYWHFR